MQFNRRLVGTLKRKRRADMARIRKHANKRRWIELDPDRDTTPRVTLPKPPTYGAVAPF